MYYLTDLNAIVLNNDSTHLPEQLAASYAEEFSVPTQLTSFAQSLWHLDHGRLKVCVYVRTRICMKHNVLSLPQEAHRKLMYHEANETVDNIVFRLYLPIVNSYRDNGEGQITVFLMGKLLTEEAL